MHLPLGVLWDLDGTLVDTGDFHYKSWALALPAFGYPFPADQFHRSFGMNNTGVLEVLLGWRPEPELATAIADRSRQLRLWTPAQEYLQHAGVGHAERAMELVLRERIPKLRQRQRPRLIMKIARIDQRAVQVPQNTQR